MLGVEERYAPPEKFATALDELHTLAGKLAGADDFGAPDYLLGLRVLLESMDYDPRFTERGKRIAWGAVATTLASRAIATREMAKLADLAAIPIEKPVIITGLHRSGTTALHKLLSLDPRFQGLQAWITSAPMPRPKREDWDDIPAFRQNVAQLQARFAAAPGLKSAHDMAAEEVDECGGILFHGFTSIVWTCAWSAASYDAWWQCQSERPSYFYFRDVLRLIGSTAPEKTWLLKHPPHIAQLDLIFELFPDARVIQTHRDPAKAIPSLCSLLMHNHPLMEEGRKEARAHLLGYRQTARAAQALRRAETVRAAHPGRILDVRHADFHRDPMACARRIYEFIGLELTPDVAAQMAHRIAQRPEAAHGAHRYTAAEFGLSENEIREQFGDYVRKYGL